MQPMLAHVAEEQLEQYAMGSLPQSGEASLEEHILLCPECQDRLEEMDVYVRTMRVAMPRLNSQQSKDLDHSPGSWFGLIRAPGLVLGAAVALSLILLLGFYTFRQPPKAMKLAPFAVVLETVRGPGGAAQSQAPRGQPLLLKADLAGLPPQGLCELEVVNAKGVPLDRSQAKAIGTRLEVRVDEGLPAGQYWVRLYSPDSATTPLREYALRVE